MQQASEATMAPPGGGLLGRFENVRVPKSAKKIIPCDAATAEYLRHDYLKPSHLPVDHVDEQANYAPSSNINETKFHRGFQRRHETGIQQNAARLEKELRDEAIREANAQAQVEATREYKEKVTFNILTGEGVGRECEFRQVGKRIVNPYGSMETLFTEHSRDATNRMKNSKHRYFDHSEPEPQQHRQHTLFNEGLVETQRQTAVLGYGKSGKARTRTSSCGTSDNYVHLRALPREPAYEKPIDGNRSQIILG